MKHIRLSALCLALGASMASHAAPMTVAIGQSQYFSALNKSIKISNISSTLKYSLGIDYDPTDCNSVGGMVAVYKVLDLQNSGTAIGVKRTYLTCSSAPEDFVLNGISISAKGQTLTIDDLDGVISEFQGMKAGTTAGHFIPGALTGGLFKIDVIRLGLTDKTIYSNFYGKRSPVGTKPEYIINKTNTPTWTYEEVITPRAIPLRELALSQNPTTTLTSAGFKVVSASATEIAFQGEYLFKRLRMPTAMISSITSALGGNSWFKTVWTEVNTPVTDPTYLAGAEGFGDLAVTVTFSMPLTP